MKTRIGSLTKPGCLYSFAPAPPGVRAAALLTAGVVCLLTAPGTGMAVEVFFPTNTLPPRWQYKSPHGSSAVHSNGVRIGTVIEGELFQAYVPPPLGNSQVQTYFARMNFRFSSNGASPVCVSAPAAVAVNVRHTQDTGGTEFYDTELLSLNISGGTLPPNVLIRESPTLVSPGQTTIRTVPGGYMIDSFFDVFTEISLDGGMNWSPCGSTTRLELAAAAPVQATSSNLPPVNSMYQAPPCFPLRFANSSVLRNLVQAGFTMSDPPPGPGASQININSFAVSLEISPDGQTFTPVHAMASMTTFIRRINLPGALQYYETEMLALDISGAGLPPGTRIRESPTLPSLGRTTIQPDGGGGWMIDSFFDVFTEISFDGGENWSPASRAQRLDLRPVEVDYFPWSLARLALRHPGGQIETVTLGGPTTVHVFIPPDGAASDTDGNGLDQVQTEMTELALRGNSSFFGPITVRLDPTHPTRGQIEEQANNTPGTLDVSPFAPTGLADSFFDVFFEIEAMGQTLRGALPARMQTVITHKPPAPGETYTDELVFGQQCLAPDNGSGTAWLPPECCEYIAPDEAMMIIDGLPPGTTIELTPTNKDFVCVLGGPAGQCFVESGSPVAGETLLFASKLQWRLQGTGALVGYDRNLTIPNVQCRVQNAPRTPGDPEQSFTSDWLQLQGQLPPGDPDFDLLRITAGTSFGLPSPGKTTLMQQPGGEWAVDSFFDITYRIDFVGAPGGPLAGRSGSTTGTIRMVNRSSCSNALAGIELLTTNGTPTGIRLLREGHTPNPEREVDVFSWSLAQLSLLMPGGQTNTITLAGPAVVHVGIPPNGLAADTDGDGLDQTPAEMVSMTLTGSSPGLGPVTVRLAPGHQTLGEIEEQANNTPGTLDVQPFRPSGTALSFFDVFFEIEVSGQTFHPSAPVRMQTIITHKPPRPGETYTNIVVFDTTQCLAPDNGQGTAWLPPECCEYIAPDDTMKIIDGLPPGTTIELAPTNGNFVCTLAGPAGLCFITDDGNPANGEILQFTSTLRWRLQGTGNLAGYDRNLTIPNVFCGVQNGPRTPGNPVQTFNGDWLQMQGQLPPGDPDFDLLRITAGTSFGLPSPGQTTLTQQPGGDWAVDSFFDITYRIDFVGAPGGPLAGRSGSTTGTIRMQTHPSCSNAPPAIQLLDANNNPTGIILLGETHTPEPEKELDVFPCTAAQVTLEYPGGQSEVISLSGPTTVHVTIPPNGQAADTDGNGRDQVPTEMVALTLTGTSSLMGPLTLRLDPTQPTVGQIEEQTNNTPGTLDVSPFAPTGLADSFFDVFFEIDALGQTLRGALPARMRAVITHKPPAPGETYTNELVFGVPPQCLAADNGFGTADLPPECCKYIAPTGALMIIDGLPPGTTIAMAPQQRNLTCVSNNFVCSFPGCDEMGGSLGGEKQCASSTLDLDLTGTGTLAGYNRHLNVQVGCETHTAPRTNGQPVQSFDTDMFRLFGQISGDPDFDLLRIVAGTDFGLPGPGHTTLTQQPGGNWAVDSFFDITYRIDFVGAPGGSLAGMSGSTTGTLRLQSAPFCTNVMTGIELLTTNGTPTGIRLLREAHTPTVERPRLEIARLPGGGIRICWPELAPCYQLQRSPNLASPTGWQDVTNPPPVVLNGQRCVTLGATNSPQFFRLYQPPSP